MNIFSYFAKLYRHLGSYIESWNLKKLTRVFVVFSLIIALVGSYFWYTRLYLTNERRFWTAINNSLATKSVTRSIISGGSGNEIVQSQRFAFAPQMASESKVSFSQRSALVDTTVVTEGVLFPDAQYSRYTSFETNQKKSDGTSPSLDDILGKWEANLVDGQNLDQSKLSYISELVSLVIFGNYDSDFRSNLISQFKEGNVYDVNYGGVTEDVVEGEDVYVFPVSVGLKGYSAQVQAAFVRAGYGEFPPLNPDNYRPDARLPARFLISKRNSNIVGVSFGSRQEVYTGFGINRTIVRPEAEFGPGELETIVGREVQGIL